MKSINNQGILTTAGAKSVVLQLYLKKQKMNQKSLHQNRDKTAKQCKDTLNIKASISTINITFNNLEYNVYKHLQKHLLRYENIRKRLLLAQEYQKWSKKKTTQVIFSDESHQACQFTQQDFCKKNEIDEQFIPTQRQFQGVLVCWGGEGISINGVDSLVRIEGTLTSQSYVDAFRFRLKRYYPGLFQAKLIFQDNNAPSHNSDYSNNWFEERNLECLEWPPQSPDLNIIENFWSKIKQQIRSYAFEEKDESWDDILQASAEILQRVFITVSKSFRGNQFEIPKEKHKILN